MKLSHRPIPLLMLALSMVIQVPAFAWGPEAREAIARSAYQILQYDIYEIAKAGDVSYEADLMRGARDGKSIIAATLPIHSDKQALDAIEYEIQLLRAARASGVGSHFAYRLGTLSALIADTMQPYGNAFTDREKVLKKSMDASIDAVIYSINPSIHKNKNNYVSSAHQYFYKYRTLYSDDYLLIREDYRHGIGYEGFSSQAMEDYFSRSVVAVVDSWYTILHPKDNPRAGKPSPDSLTSYYVKEIGYLLDAHENIKFAKRAYGVYQESKTSMIETHIEVGDLFYSFATEESMEIGVTEWKIAQAQPGRHRNEAARRLSTHYISEGDDYVAHSLTPEYFESDLNDAIYSYRNALTYDRTNEVAARKIIETSAMKRRREKSYQREQNFIDKGLEKIEEADSSRMNKNFTETLASYNAAISLFRQVGDDFRDLVLTAGNNINAVNKNKKATIREVIDTANANMEEADDALVNAEYDAATALYYSVISDVKIILSVVLEGSVNEKTVNALIDTANYGIEDTQKAKERAAAKPKPTVRSPKR